MKITRRQEEFINNLLELHREVKGPIHYSLLAERLGVSPFTAYDMLCMLEEKGMVRSEYKLPTEKSGPGRAERVFYPVETTEERERLMAEAGGVDLEGEALKQFILDRLRKWEIWDKELAEELLARIPDEGQGRIRYCVEVMTIVSIRLRQTDGRQVILDYLPQIIPANTKACRANLCLLGGFTFGILAQECVSDQEWVQKLLEHVQNYLNIVIQMSPDDCRQLGEYLVTVFKTLSEGKSNS